MALNIMLLFFCLLERHQLHETFWTHLSLKLSLSFSWSAFYHICILLSCVLAIYNLIPISVTIFSSFLSLIWLYFFLSSVPFCSVFYLSEGVFLTFYLQILVLRCFISSEYHYVNFLLPHIFLFLGIRRAIHQLQSLWFTLFVSSHGSSEWMWLTLFYFYSLHGQSSQFKNTLFLFLKDYFFLFLLLFIHDS